MGRLSTIKHDTLQQQLNNAEDTQISTDPDSRSIIIVKSAVEVAYNIQNAVDDKHNLIVHAPATNTNDGKALHKANKTTNTYTPGYMRTSLWQHQTTLGLHLHLT